MSLQMPVLHSRIPAGAKLAAAAALLLGLSGCVVAPLPYHHGYYGRGAAPSAYPHFAPGGGYRDGRGGRRGWGGGHAAPYEGDRRGYD